jgi:lipopolysaccharide transport system ATP-binding protein
VTLDPIIRVRDLGKQYRIGTQSAAYGTLREALVDAVRAPFVRMREGGRVPEDTFWALRSISFEVRPGEVVGIIGHNGAGKSTLLKILSRITEPTTGQVDLYGRVASLLEVGTGFHPELTGRENIFLNGAILGMTRREIAARFDDIVAFAGVARFTDTPVKHYSSGMYLRLAFAVAAHMEPEILLVDEVLAVGDAAFQKKSLGKMEDVARQGRTVLFVSHNLAAMRSLCSRGLLLSGGQLVFTGPIQECIDHYLQAADDDDASEVDVRDTPRQSVGVDPEGALRITRVRIVSASGRAHLRTGQPVEVEMAVATRVPLKEVVLGLAVKSSDNILLFECRSTDAGGPIPNLDPGEYLVRARLAQNPLNPGLYTLSVGARCEDRALDYLPDLITLRVDSAERFESLWLEAPSGHFRVPSRWDLPES